MGITHSKVSTRPPSGDPDEISRDDWNEPHVGGVAFDSANEGGSLELTGADPSVDAIVVVAAPAGFEVGTGGDGDLLALVAEDGTKAVRFDTYGDVVVTTPGEQGDNAQLTLTSTDSPNERAILNSHQDPGLRLVRADRAVVMALQVGTTGTGTDTDMSVYTTPVAPDFETPPPGPDGGGAWALAGDGEIYFNPTGDAEDWVQKVGGGIDFDQANTGGYLSVVASGNVEITGSNASGHVNVVSAGSLYLAGAGETENINLGTTGLELAGFASHVLLDSDGTWVGYSGTEALGFYGETPIVRPTVTGAGDAALGSLLAALADLGLVVDSSSRPEPYGQARADLGLHYLEDDVPTTWLWEPTSAATFYDPDGFVLFASELELVTVEATGGTFTLTSPLDLAYGTTGAIDFDASVGDVQAAIDADWLAGIVLVGGMPGAWTLDWSVGPHVDQPFNPTTIDVGSLSGGGYNAVDVTTRGGGTWAVPAGLGGVYLLTVHVGWDSNADGTRTVILNRTGEDLQDDDWLASASAVAQMRQNLTAVADCPEGTDVKLELRQNSGDTRFLAASMEWVRVSALGS